MSPAMTNECSGAPKSIVCNSAMVAATICWVDEPTRATPTAYEEPSTFIAFPFLRFYTSNICFTASAMVINRGG